MPILYRDWERMSAQQKLHHLATASRAHAKRRSVWNAELGRHVDAYAPTLGRVVVSDENGCSQFHTPDAALDVAREVRRKARLKMKNNN